jgi:hypothetical protein
MMGVFEWLGAHFARPRPDVRILELEPTGGGTFVDFSAFVQNYGTQPCRCGIAASVGDRPVDCAPAIVDLLVGDTPKRIAIHVPRPELGDLVKAFDDETTLYGADLIMQVNDGKRMTSKTWAEHVYTPSENRERHDLQQRLWRAARGEADGSPA